MKNDSNRISDDDPPDWIAAIARGEARELGRNYRVVVIEGDARRAVNDFSTLDEAVRYADDVASESDVPWPIAFVFAPGFQFVRRGRHYARS